MSYVHESMARAYLAERLEEARRRRLSREVSLSRRKSRRAARPAQQD